VAIIICGQTKCSLCGFVIEDGQRASSFPHFIQNELDPLSIFNDGAFHLDCFRRHPLAEKAEKLYEEMLQRLSAEHRTCVVCHKPVTDPDDYFGIGLLTEDERTPVHLYNYTQGHSSCLPKWKHLRQAHKLIRDLRFSPSWRGHSLDGILLQLEKAIEDSETIVRS
jgi:hypothetical protein